MKHLLLLFLWLSVTKIYATDQQDSLLNRLNVELAKKNSYDALRLNRIKQLEELLRSKEDLNFRYGICLKLYEEYKSFNFNKAFNYALKLQELGRLLNDQPKIAYGKVKLGFTLLSSGMFKETFDSLKTVNVKLLSAEGKKEYYFITARTYYDLVDFVKDDYFSSIYNKAAKLYIDSAVAFCKPNSFEQIYYNGLKYMRAGERSKAVVNLQDLLDNKYFKLTEHQYAVVASTLSSFYILSKQPKKAINLLIWSAVADVRSATKEATAMASLAQLLYKEGDVENAYIFIKAAMDDATYYGARQRKIQVGNILPIIAGQRINYVENQRRALVFYASLLTLLTITIVIFAIISYKQLQKLKLADKVILETNQHLQEKIRELDEANKIKEEYIGYYFNLISEYIEKLEKFKRSVDHKLITKRFDDIRILVDNINLTKEREELFINFDKAFLTIFPNFVKKFNTFFSEENQIKLLPHQLLNTDLRIFALIRLGIIDTEKIAHILGYSVNTIYNYKARLKSKSNITNDDFEQAVMSIEAT